MANFYIVRSGTAATANANNTNGYTQISGIGTLTVADGNRYVVDPAVDTGFSFSPAIGSTASITVDFLQSNTATSLTNAHSIIFNTGITATVNIAAGVDANNFILYAGAATGLTLTLGDGATIGSITGADSTTIITAGNNVTFSGTVNTVISNTATVSVGNNVTFSNGVNMEAANATQTFITGTGATILGNIEMSASCSTYVIDLGANSTIRDNINMGGSQLDATIHIGDGSTLGTTGVGNINVGGSGTVTTQAQYEIVLGSDVDMKGDLAMGGSYIDGYITVGENATIGSDGYGGMFLGGSQNQFCIAFKDGATLNGDLAMGGSFNSQFIQGGDNVTIKGSILMGGDYNTNSLKFGDGFTLGGSWYGSGANSIEYIELGDDWTIDGGIYLYAGSDNIVLGEAAQGQTAIIDGGIGTDGISVTPPSWNVAGFEAAAKAAGWAENADGSWSPTGSGQTLTFGGVTYQNFETSADTSADPDCSCCNNFVTADGVVDGTDSDDTMPVGYADSEGDEIDGTDGDDDTIEGNGGNDSIAAGAGNDVVFGGADNDTVDGGIGDDTLSGDAGMDSLIGNTGADSLVGGAGNDTLDGGANDDILDGGDDADSLTGGAGDDLLYGGAANDTLAGGTGNDSLYGGGGDDTFLLATSFGNDSITGGETGEVDGDTLDATALTESTTLTLTTPESGTLSGASGTATFAEIENILLGGGNDTVVGSSGGDEVDGGSGNDILSGNAGNDSLSGGTGNDTLDGGADNDTLDGGTGADSLIGGTGNDSLTGGAGSDTLIGGAGNDTLSGEEGDDDITLAAGDLADGGAGDDEFTFDGSISGGGSITVTGGETDEEAVTDPTNNPSARTGDVLDLRTLASVTITYDETDPTWDGTTSESGTATYLNDDGDLVTITFSQIENILLSPDGVVDGTSGDDSMGIGYTDTQGDEIDGTDGINDVIDAAAGNDLVDAGAGDDTVSGGSGNDSVFGDEGDDVVSGGTGNDTLQGSTGNDSLSGDADEDKLYGGSDNDTIFGGADNDTVLGSEGRDLISGDGGDDLLYGGNSVTWATDLVNAGGVDPLPADNADTISGGAGRDTIYGFDDNDSLSGDAGNDVIDGGIDDDTLSGGDADDSLIGGQGNDVLDGGNDTDTLTGDAGNDTLSGGAGNDSLSGGAGRDSLIGGAGNDTLTGGADADAFTANGADLITDFDATTGIDGTTGAATTDNDYVDLTSFYNEANLAIWNAANPGQQYNDPLDWLRADQADGVLQQAGNLRIQSGGTAVSATLLNAENTGVVCFTRGTLIITARGEKPIESLAPGDLVLTMDHGYQPIRWIGSTTVAGKGRFAPIQIAAGALGNRRALAVSPQHRMMLSGWQAELLFDEPEVLVAAKLLVNDRTIRVMERDSVEYFHMLFDAHEIVFAEGCPSESFHPGHVGWGALAEAARQEILTLFPQLADLDFALYGPSARRSLSAAEARVARDAMQAEEGQHAAE